MAWVLIIVVHGATVGSYYGLTRQQCTAAVRTLATELTEAEAKQVRLFCEFGVSPVIKPYKK